MNEINLNSYKHIHCIGIGGIGISALARLLVHNGKTVSGTNDNESKETLDDLRAKGVVVTVSLDPKDLPVADLYIYSDAWKTFAPEVLEEAKKRDVPVLSYFEALGIVANAYYLIAVSGTHGKTTTSAMITDVLEAGYLDPTAIVGSLRTKTKSNFRAGKGKYFVAEACEYMRHFLNFSPHILVITNIDTDHLDYYKDLADIQSAFRELALKVPNDGVVICRKNDPNVKPVIEGLRCEVVDYSERALTSKLKVPGAHNRENAKAAQAVADFLQVPKDKIQTALENFTGTWRRGEYKGKTQKGVVVYDDYAHHPAEVKAALQGFRELFTDKKLTVVFQPHLYSRTRLLLDDFADALSGFDTVIIAPIYAAREKDDGTISGNDLAKKIQEKNKNVTYIETFEAIEKELMQNAKDGDVVITIGAGDVYKIGEKLIV